MSTSRSENVAPGAGYHHGNLRQALLAAGLEWLEQTQNPEFSLRELTRKVGVSVTAAYRHFASKEALLAAMAVEGFHRLVMSQMQAIQAHPDQLDGFMAAGRAYVLFARNNPALFRLMYGRFAATNPDPELHVAAQKAFDGMAQSMALMVNRSLDDPLVEVAAIRAWSTVHGLSHLIIDGQVDVHTDNIDALIDTVFQSAELRMMIKGE